MYQSIDTEEEARADAEAAAALGSTSVGPWVWASLGVAFLTLVMVTWMSLSGPGAPVAESEPGASSRGLYLRAVGEPSPALRRARLRDFVDAQPRSPRSDAARAAGSPGRRRGQRLGGGHRRCLRPSADIH